MPRNFVEAGGASSVLAIADSAGVPLEQTQKELTPLQRMVITLGAEKMQEEAQNEQGSGPRTGGNAQVGNSLAGGAGSGAGSIQGETVEYVNEGVRDE
jgi:hypothetical protein